MCGLESPQNFHCFSEHTVLFVGGINEADMFNMNIERMKFSPRVSIGTCHLIVRKQGTIA